MVPSLKLRQSNFSLSIQSGDPKLMSGRERLFSKLDRSSKPLSPPNFSSISWRSCLLMRNYSNPLQAKIQLNFQQMKWINLCKCASAPKNSRMQTKSLTRHSLKYHFILSLIIRTIVIRFWLRTFRVNIQPKKVATMTLLLVNLRQFKMTQTWKKWTAYPTLLKLA